MGPEDRFKARVLRKLRALGGWWYSVPRSRFGVSGIPDAIGCVNGLFFAIEFKDPKGSYGVTQTQERQLALINDAGGTGFVCDSENEAQVIINYVRSIIEYKTYGG